MWHFQGGQNILWPSYIFSGVRTPQPPGSTPLTDAVYLLTKTPSAFSRVVRIDPLHFLPGCRKRRLNQALSVFSVSILFSVFAIFRATFSVSLVTVFVYYFNCTSFAIRLSGRKVVIKLIDWLIYRGNGHYPPGYNPPDIIPRTITPRTNSPHPRTLSPLKIT